MKEKRTVASKLPEGFRFNPALNEEYDQQPLFKDKIDRANHILKTVGLPEIRLAQTK